jgi:hypothetical protein
MTGLTCEFAESLTRRGNTLDHFAEYLPALHPATPRLAQVTRSVAVTGLSAPTRGSETVCRVKPSPTQQAALDTITAEIAATRVPPCPAPSPSAPTPAASRTAAATPPRPARRVPAPVRQREKAPRPARRAPGPHHGDHRGRQRPGVVNHRTGATPSGCGLSPLNRWAAPRTRPVSPGQA